MIDKNQQLISKMFNQISPTYDLLNRLLSFGIDKRWRRHLASCLPKQQTLKLLDLATGTGDQLIAILDAARAEIHAVGVDIAEEMVKIGKEKLRHRPNVDLQVASAAALPFPDESFDCATISFGIRNMENIDLCLQEIRRTLKKEGRLLILEFSLPKNRLIRAASLFYLRTLLPFIGGLISKNKQAYAYLNQTIEAFPYGDSFCALLEQAGFSQVSCTPLTFGIASLYQGTK